MVKTSTSPAQVSRAWHVDSAQECAQELGVPSVGITGEEALARLARFGPNRIEPPPPPSGWFLFLRQFKSPLIYVLLVAALVALALDEVSDAGFIFAVLGVNALIGFLNEARADREVRALATLMKTRARVRRGGRALDIDGECVVPGDLLLLESGARVSADLRLIESHGLRVDESLLTGESMPVEKDPHAVLAVETPLAELRNMAFAGSLVASGRGMGLVVATGARSEVGAIAGQVAAVGRQPPPLIVRMERFARVLGVLALLLSAALVGIGLARGEALGEILLAAIALAVSAIPEGLPIALTVALAVAVSRMARRRVVVRNLPAVEGLGSCGVIATDKTGTLTRNELTVERVAAGGVALEVSGVGYAPRGEVHTAGRPLLPGENRALDRLLRAVCLANEGSLSLRDSSPDEWDYSGDPTDVALLALAIKAGTDPSGLLERHPTVNTLPFEAERRFSASFHERDGGGLTCVKGAPERILGMCSSELMPDGASRPLDGPAALALVEEHMIRGYRVLAIADAEGATAETRGSVPPEPTELVFLGLVAMTDPPRVGVAESIAACSRAGIRVVMITGDHATTASAIAARIGIAREGEEPLSGQRIGSLTDDELVECIDRYSVIARATPAEKLRIVQAWQRHGSFVAVTGDGVNDAPALRQGNLGVAMGRGGTDVAREAADLIITDDDFSSIVAGVEEGRIAYDNIRKATYLLISTGAGEVLLVTAAIAIGLPIPFLAAQLLWLNLVTNGIQDVALVFEPGEPGVLDRPVRKPGERIFNRLMIERTLVAGLIMGGIGLASWASWTDAGLPVEEARNRLVQLFVLFEIFHIGNSRSETISFLRLNPLRNKVLFLGTLSALALHLLAMYTPWFQQLLGIGPLTIAEWWETAVLAAPLLVLMELHKWWWRARARRSTAARA